MRMMKRIYLDHAATTPTDPRVVKAMMPYFSDISGNPSSLHKEGLTAAHALDLERQRMAGLLEARPEELIFTGSGTESDCLALYGIAHSYREHGTHIIVSLIEHKAVLEAARRLENEGFAITYLPVDKNGLVSRKMLSEALRPDTILVSIMTANNEIGTIEPIAELAALVHNFRGERPYPFFHTDACQAAGALDIRPERLGVDLLTMNGSKIYGPKGVGLLYVRRGIALSPLIIGGGQERGRRAGTESIALIAGLVKAFDLAEKGRMKESARQSALRDRLFEGILARIPKSRLNGHQKRRLPNNAHLSFYGIEGESLLLLLDASGVAASTASACSVHDLAPSHVLRAIGLPDAWAHSSIRFTLGRSTTKKDIDYVILTLPALVERLRKLSPFHGKKF